MIIRFHNPDGPNGYLSNWYNCRYSEQVIHFFEIEDDES